MAYKYDNEARYTETHEWVRLEEEEAVCGISDYAQHALSDVVYVEMPEVGETYAKGDPVAVVESVKAAEDVFMPMSGTITAINERLEDEAELVNQDPYGEGWFFRFRPENRREFESLMDVAAYEQHVAAEEAAEH
ncbi:MAG TPA: glycine cleavage system protein GcvH [Anaerolineae bacterium]|nr:glycine cleavage system protein GcvH [Anaerolineae bacterium]HIQ05551.1 glycine cleavage system protein GcvH [Anaerolineae bacterium]